MWFAFLRCWIVDFALLTTATYCIAFIFLGALWVVQGAAPQLPEYSAVKSTDDVESFLLIIVLAPLVETALLVALPYLVLSKIGHTKSYQITVVVGTIFGLAHWLSPAHVIFGASLGFAYGAYVSVRQANIWCAFLVISLSHAFRNLVSFLI